MPRQKATRSSWISSAACLRTTWRLPRGPRRCSFPASKASKSREQRRCARLGSYGAPASILFLAALTRFSPHRVWRGLHFALLCVARVLGWCDHDYPRWGGHNIPVRLTTVQLFHVLVAPASLIGPELS